MGEKGSMGQRGLFKVAWRRKAKSAASDRQSGWLVELGVHGTDLQH